MQQTGYSSYTLISELVYTKPSSIADDVDHIATHPLCIEFDKKLLLVHLWTYASKVQLLRNPRFITSHLSKYCRQRVWIYHMFVYIHSWPFDFVYIKVSKSMIKTNSSKVSESLLQSINPSLLLWNFPYLISSIIHHLTVATLMSPNHTYR